MRMWEWSEVFFLRLLVFLYVVSGFFFYILKLLNLLEVIILRIFVVVLRLVMIMVLFIIDIIVFKICKCFYMDLWFLFVVFGSLLVILVFNIWIFFNGVEIILFVLLLFLVIFLMVKRDIIFYLKFDFVRYFFMGFFIGMGVWICLIFMVFICVLVLWWLLDICFSKWIVEKNIVKFVYFVLK